MNNIWDNETIETVEKLFSIIHKISLDFYMQADYILNCNSYNDSKKDSIRKKIIDIYLGINIQLIKFRFSLGQRKYRQNRGIYTYPDFSLNQVVSYMDKITSIIHRFSYDRRILNDSNYISSQQDILNDLLKKIKSFEKDLESEFNNDVNDIFNNVVDNEKRVLKKILRSYKKKMTVHEELILRIKKYKNSTNVSNNDIQVLEININNHIYNDK